MENKFQEMPRRRIRQSEMEKNIGKCACSFLAGVVVCFGALVSMGVL